jgi:hypothetical protein
VVSSPLSPARQLYSPRAAKLVDRAMGLIVSSVGRFIR